MSMEEKAKERVVGAAVLMAVAVIFIPMILSGPKEDGQEDARKTPSVEQNKPRSTGSGFSSRIVPRDERGETGAAEPEKPVPPVSVASAPAEKPAPPPPAAKPVKKPVANPKPRKPAARPAAKPSPKASSDPGWVVQLGSFANARNAHALRDRLKKKGYSAYAVSSGTGKDAVTRVYVGPEADRAKAQGHVDRLLEDTRLKGIVVRRPG